MFRKVLDQRRSLPIALAHEMVKLKPGAPRGDMLARIFRTLTVADQVVCRNEVHWCRLARRGDAQAEVA